MREEGIWARAFVVLAPLLTACGVLVVGLFLSNPRSRWLIAAFAVAVAVAASTLVTILLSRFYLERMQNVIVARLTSSALTRLGRRDGWTQEELSELESDMEVETIWIVGANFDNEANQDGPFLNVVRRNIHERGISYVYVAPDSADIRELFDRLRNELALAPDDIRFRTLEVNDETWQRMPYTPGNFTIYDPTTRGVSPSGYSWDPGGDGKSFVRLRHDVVVKWVAKLKDLCPGIDRPDEGGADRA